MRKALTMLVAVSFAAVVYAESYNDMYKTGRGLYNKRKYAEAEKLFEKAVAASKNASQKAEAQRMLAYSYALQGQKVKAAGVFEDISKNKDLKPSRRLEGAKNAMVYYSNAKAFDKADKVAADTKDIESDDPVHTGIRFYGIAYSLNARKQPDKALEAIKKAQEECEDDKYWGPVCDLLLLDILYQNNKHDELIKTYSDEVIEEKKPAYHKDYYYRRALAKQVKKDFPGAAADFQKTYDKSNGTHNYALYFKANCLIAQKKYAEALKVLNIVDKNVKSGGLSKNIKKQIDYVKKMQK